jgi:hypothetical protein
MNKTPEEEKKRREKEGKVRFRCNRNPVLCGGGQSQTYCYGARGPDMELALSIEVIDR